MAVNKIIYSSKFVFVSTLFWVVINLLSIYFLSEETSRWFRVATSTYFVIWSLCFQPLNSKINYVLFPFIICDITLLFYENEIFNFITFIARSITFYFLISLVFPKIRAIKFSLLELIVGIIVIAINIFLLFELIYMVPEAHLYDYFVPAYLAFAILSMMLVGAAITYNNRYSQKKTIYFLLAALFMALSDVNFFIAYYLEFPVFYYPDRFMHIFSLGLILLFWLKPLRLSEYDTQVQDEV